MPIHQVGDDEDINAAIIRVVGTSDINWHGDGHFAGDSYVFTGHALGDIIRVAVNREGQASFTVH